MTLPGRSALGLMAGVLCAAASPPYLPAVGPPPLRFLPPVSHAAARISLPSLPPPGLETNPVAALPNTDPALPPTEAVVRLLTNSAPTDPALALASNPSAPPAESEPRTPLSANPVQTVAVEEPVLSPGVFMKYFTPRTNGAGVTLITPATPMEFVPPMPATPRPAPSSKATYSKSP